MLLTTELLDELAVKAARSPRLRLGHDLRTTPQDGSQRMINMLMPGTRVPVHRHPASAETMIVLRGAVTEVYYDNDGHEVARYLLAAGSDAYGIQIPAGQWHTVLVSQPCAIIEIKDGPYAPPAPDDILDV